MFLEQLHQDWGQWFKVEEVLYQEKTPICDQLIFENPTFGKVHVIDGIVQSTEADEYVYQEMLSHVPLLAHGHAKTVLIIGGGDGGILRETLKHPLIEKVDLCTIDPVEIEFSKTHLAHLSQGAFDHPKAHIFIDDGAHFVKACESTYDIIIIDSSDPIGPSAALFTDEFYSDCKSLLNKGGILVNMAGVPFLQTQVMQMIHSRLKPLFKDVTFFLASTPTYVGGFMALGFATNNTKLRKIPIRILEDRFKELQGPLHYYNPRIHQAAFALPTYVENALSS